MYHRRFIWHDMAQTTDEPAGLSTCRDMRPTEP